LVDQPLAVGIKLGAEQGGQPSAKPGKISAPAICSKTRRAKAVVIIARRIDRS
jgi:hypothetical protein